MVVHGQQGQNMPIDLHIEHLNKIAISFLHSNKYIIQIGQSISTLLPVLDKFNEDNHIQKTSSSHKRSMAEINIQ